MKVKKDMQDI